MFKQLFKRLSCEHDYALYQVNERSFSLTRTDVDLRILCGRCGKKKIVRLKSVPCGASYRMEVALGYAQIMNWAL